MTIMFTTDWSLKVGTLYGKEVSMKNVQDERCFSLAIQVQNVNLINRTSEILLKFAANILPSNK